MERIVLTVDEYLKELEQEGVLFKTVGNAGGFVLDSNSPASTASRSDTGQRLTTLLISTAGADRTNDQLDPLGCDLTLYKSNPLFLWEHGLKGNKQDQVLGRTLQVDQYPTHITALCEYVMQEHSKLPAQIYELETKGLLPGNSIGWRPTGNVTRGSDGIRRVGKWELLDISKVLIPMNGEASNHRLA